MKLGTLIGQKILYRMTPGSSPLDIVFKVIHIKLVFDLERGLIFDPENNA